MILVFLSDDFVKLGDFGLSKDMGTAAFTSTYVGVSRTIYTICRQAERRYRHPSICLQKSLQRTSTIPNPISGV